MEATAPPKRLPGTALRFNGDQLIGQVLGDKYRILSVLGRGGMAIVFAAKHVTLGHNVAVKILKPDFAGTPSQAARILREARAAAGLTSENATRVLDIGALDSGEPYIVMEQLLGADLGRVLETGALPLSDAAGYLVQACDAIAEAHGMNIVHRDLKPSNLFLTSRRDGSPLVKLMDFGISKLISAEAEESLTATQDSLGTPHYMSPEQLMTARDVDSRSDVWALGVILYRMLTGEPPFVGETTPAVHVAVASAPAPRLRDKLPDAPPEVEQLVLDCLVKSRTERLQSVQAFARVLLAYTDEDTRRRYAHLASTDAAPVRPNAAPSPSLDVAAPTEPETHSAWGTLTKPAPGRRSWAVLGSGAVAVVAVSVLGSSWATRRFAAAPQPSAASEPIATAAPADSSPPAATTTAPPRASASVEAVATSPAPVRRWPRPPSPGRAAPASKPDPPPAPKLDPYGQRH